MHTRYVQQFASMKLRKQTMYSYANLHLFHGRGDLHVGDGRFAIKLGVISRRLLFRLVILVVLREVMLQRVNSLYHHLACYVTEPIDSKY